MPQTRLLFFGNATTNITATIRDLETQAKSSFLLGKFLDSVLRDLKSQASNLDAFDRERFSSFRSFDDLAKREIENGSHDAVLHPVLHCVAQFGSLIVQVENGPEILGHDPATMRTIVGLCFGLLPATAACAAKDVTQLMGLALEIVAVALRLAIFAHHRSSKIEPSGESWAVVVSGIDSVNMQKAINRFHTEQMTPLHRSVYVSAESSSSITISGPPSVLEKFLSTSEVKLKDRKHNIPVSAAYHATHLGQVDVHQIVGDSPSFELQLAQNARLFSTSSGMQYSATNLRELLQQAVNDILYFPLYVKKTIDAAIDKLSGGEVMLSIFGPTNSENSLRQALKIAGIKATDSLGGANKQSSLAQNSPGTIAIVGMSGRFPGGENLDEFWKVLERGDDLHKKVPKDRFDFDTYCDPSGQTKNTTLSAFGCFVDNPGLFDTRMFNMSPREAAQTDPTHRLLLMAVYEALEMAGYNPNSKLRNEKFGTFIGMSSDDWREYNLAQDIDMYYVTGGIRAFAAGRLNYHFKWDGPSYVVDTVCSSSAAAVELAYVSLLNRTVDVAVAGGGNIMTGPNFFTGLSRGGFLSTTGSSKTFDNGADGYCRGDAVGAVVLKRLEDAIASNDNIQGIIRSAATNHSAYASSITRPHSPTQQNLCQLVLRNAGLQSNDINYVEMHGTGTQAGDTAEMNSIVGTFGNGRKSDNPLYVGSVKSNVGHGEGAAGVTSIIKSMMMFRKNVIPAHAGIKTSINKKFPPLADMNIHIARAPRSFENVTRSESPKYILLNSFGATGGNTCMVLEEPPKAAECRADPRSHFVVALSAKTSESLKGNKERLRSFLISHNSLRLEDVAYTTTARRMHHSMRSAYAVGSVSGLIGALSKDLYSSPGINEAVEKPPVIFTFPGQGSLFAGMGQQLFDTSPVFKEILLDLDQTCMNLGFSSFVHIITNVATNISLLGPVQVHHALVAFEIALARLWLSWGIKPDLLIGHSLGEYSALCIAGVLSTTDALFLVGKRAELIQEACTKQSHGMLLIPSSLEEVNQLLSRKSIASCVVACINGPSSTVVSGSRKDLQELQHWTSKRCNLLDIDYAFHSPQLDIILADFEKIAKSVRFAEPVIPVASTMLGKVVTNVGVFSAAYLRDQTRKPVNFMGALQDCSAKGYSTQRTLWVELGPETMTLNMIRSTLNTPVTNLLATRKTTISCWKTLSDSISQVYNSGATINWIEYHRQFESNLRLLDLPTYCFTLKNYWIQFEGKVTSAIKSIEVEKPQPFLSTCLHRVESENFSKDQIRVTFTSDLKDLQLLSLIDGHCVGGVALCPSSVYSDIAFTAGNYIHKKEHPSKTAPAMEQESLEIFSPLIAQPDASLQTIEVVATKLSGSSLIQISISSNVGSSSQEHARCTVSFGESKQWIEKWSRQKYLLQERICRLVDSSSTIPVHRLLGDMVYKIFSQIVQYSSRYQQIIEIHMDSKLNEAVARVRFRQTPEDCNFTYDPCWIDCLAQVAGFVLNGSVNTPQDTIFMSTGCESLQVSTELSCNKDYLCYVRVQPVGTSGATVGDVSLIDGDVIVAIVAGLRFQEIKRSVLPHLLKSTKQKAGTNRTLITQRRSQEIEKPTTVTHTDVATKQSSSVPRTFISPGAIIPNTVSKRAESTSPLKRKADSVIPTILGIIAEEVGWNITDITDKTSFEELGIDSLLTISITSKLRSDANLDLPASMFATSSTVADLRAYFKEEAIPEVFPESNLIIANEMYNSTSTEDPMSSSTSQTSNSSEDDHIIDVFFAAVAKETGLNPSELTNDTSFADLGVDSLMSIAIVGTIKDQTGVQLPASIFNDHPTVAEMRKALFKPLKLSAPRDVIPPIPADTKETTLFGSGHAVFTPEPAAIKPKLRPPFKPEDYSSNAVFIQGDLNSTLPALFMLTDGAGSAASYLHFPQFHERLPIYAMESPFLHCPYEYTCSIEEICEIFVRAIRTIQPHGPYLLGGWSIGGAYSYDTARQLALSGEKILGILLIDSACPKPMPGVLNITMDALAELTLFMGIPTRGGGEKPMPSDQKQHLLACVRAFVEYVPTALDPEHRPAHTVILWSRRGMFENLTPKLKEAMDLLAGQQEGKDKTGINHDWLTGERTTFDPKGWDKLLHTNDIEIHPIEGDHFSIMRLPGIKDITGPRVQSAITKFLSSPSLTPSKSSSFLPVKPASIQQIFHETRYDYDIFSQEVGFSDWWSLVYPENRRLVLAYTLEGFAGLGCDISKMKSGQVFSSIEVLPRHQKLFDHLFDILEDAGLLKVVGNKRIRTSATIDNTASFAILEKCIRDFPRHASTHQLISITGSRLADCLTGKADPLRLLFGNNVELLEEVYSNSPIVAVTTKHLGRNLADALRNASGHIEILEIGAGLGGATKHLVDILNGLGISFTYTFTDISQSLVTAGRKKFKKEPNMKFMVLDVEKAPSEKDHGRFDIIISTNCLHTTLDLKDSGANALKLLKREGFLCLAELTRRQYWYDLVFGLLDGWWRFDDGRKYALASPELWDSSLKAAGFKHVTWTESRSSEAPVSRLITAFPLKAEKDEFIVREMIEF